MYFYYRFFVRIGRFSNKTAWQDLVINEEVLMYRISALNDASSAADERQEEGSHCNPSREVLESTAHSSHSAAILQLSKGQDEKAHDTFLSVLENPYVANVSANFIASY